VKQGCPEAFPELEAGAGEPSCLDDITDELQSLNDARFMCLESS
jgi:hypothetical protein